MENNNNDKEDKAAGFFTRLLTGWGVPGGIARIIAGAIIGALAALAALTQNGCKAPAELTPEQVQQILTIIQDYGK